MPVEVHAVVGLCTVVGLMVFLSLAVVTSRQHTPVKRLIIYGLLLRAVGALAYLYFVGSYYGGGDYLHYFSEGRILADRLWDPTTEANFDESYFAGKWWGTPLVVRITAGFIFLVGPTLSGIFLLYALVGYLGILCFYRAYTTAFPTGDSSRYLAWIALFPSLWFWPSAIGKDSIVLAGLGITTLGYVSNGGRRLSLMMIGAAAVFVIRPQVAVTFACALVAGQWIGSDRPWGVLKVIQGVVVSSAAVAVFVLSSGALGFDLFQSDQVEEYLEGRSTASSYGGSALNDAAGVSYWMAPVNVLLRPFPWEAGGPLALIAAAEVSFLWIVGWAQRRRIGRFVSSSRQAPLFWMSLTFILMYSIALGLAAGNLGIIARQRVHLLPFAFMFFSGRSVGALPRIGRSGAQHATS